MLTDLKLVPGERVFNTYNLDMGQFDLKTRSSWKYRMWTLGTSVYVNNKRASKVKQRIHFLVLRLFLLVLKVCLGRHLGVNFECLI